MLETYISMAEVMDRIQTHKDINNTHKSRIMLIRLGEQQDLARKPRTHIKKSKQLTPIKNIFDSI